MFEKLVTPPTCARETGPQKKCNNKQNALFCYDTKTSVPAAIADLRVDTIMIVKR